MAHKGAVPLSQIGVRYRPDRFAPPGTAAEGVLQTQPEFIAASHPLWVTSHKFESPPVAPRREPEDLTLSAGNFFSTTTRHAPECIKYDPGYRLSAVPELVRRLRVAADNHPASFTAGRRTGDAPNYWQPARQPYRNARRALPCALVPRDEAASRPRRVRKATLPYSRRFTCLTGSLLNASKH